MGEKEALLVVDVVNFCCSEKCERPSIKLSFSRIRKMVPKLSSFISAYRKKRAL